MSQKEKPKKELLRVSNVRLVYDENTYNALPPQRTTSTKDGAGLTRASFQDVLKRASRKIAAPDEEKDE